MDEIIDRIAGLLDIETKSIDEIIYTFQQVLNVVFEDNIFHRGRLFTVEKFALCIVRRAVHIDPVLLLAALRYRIHLVCTRID